MKWKPVLCMAALALGAGCKSQQNPYASFGEYGFSFDLEQSPVPGLTVAENDRIMRMPNASPTQLLNQTVMPPPLSQDAQGAKVDAGSGVPSPVPTAMPAAVDSPAVTPTPTPPPTTVPAPTAPPQ